MSEIYFRNYRIDPDVEYFLYIGELKNYGLNVFLKEALNRLLQRPVDFIAIVPDIWEQYDYANIAVINPLALEKILICKQKHSCRIPGPAFMRSVSQSSHVRKLLIASLLDQQDRVYIYMYESNPEMSSE